MKRARAAAAKALEAAKAEETLEPEAGRLGADPDQVRDDMLPEVLLRADAGGPGTLRAEGGFTAATPTSADRALSGKSVRRRRIGRIEAGAPSDSSSPTPPPGGPRPMASSRL